MNYDVCIGKRVLHSSDGKGIITEFRGYNNYFKVKFDNGVERLYEYPEDFDSTFLIADDEELKAIIDKDLKLWNGELINYTFNGKELYGLSDSKETKALEADPNTTKTLIKGYSYGSDAHSIYKSLCANKAFNWDGNNSSRFAKQQSLYSKNCTQEGYAVWFLSYSSYNFSKNEKRGIANNIEESTNNINEEWDLNIDDKPVEDAREIKVTFVKNNKGQYEFWGVLLTNEEDINKTDKPYSVYNRFVSDTYIPGNKY